MKHGTQNYPCIVREKIVFTQTRLELILYYSIFTRKNVLMCVYITLIYADSLPRLILCTSVDIYLWYIYYLFRKLQRYCKYLAQ